MEIQDRPQDERNTQATEIIHQLQVGAAPVLETYDVIVAYLHGSVAKGRPRPGSDIDIAILLADLPPAYERLLLEFAIQADLEDACHLRRLDVCTINTAPIMVQGPIVQEGLLLYSRDKAERIAFEVLVRKKYFDYLPTARRMQKAFLKHIQEKGILRGQS